MTEHETDTLGELALRAEQGEVTHIDLIEAFLATTIYVPSVTDPEEGEINPVMSTVQDVEYMVVASTVAALERTADVALYGVPMDGRVCVTGINPAFSLLVNTETGAFAMPKAMLDDIRATGGPLG